MVSWPVHKGNGEKHIMIESGGVGSDVLGTPMKMPKRNIEHPFPLTLLPMAIPPRRVGIRCMSILPQGKILRRCMRDSAQTSLTYARSLPPACSQSLIRQDLMAFRSLATSSSLPTFPTRAQIQDYLITYAKTFDLYPHIQFQTTVQRLYRPSDQEAGWVIEYADKTGQGSIEVDYVCCANGHYADGWIPQTPGLR